MGGPKRAVLSVAARPSRGGPLICQAVAAATAARAIGSPVPPTLCVLKHHSHTHTHTHTSLARTICTHMHTHTHTLHTAGTHKRAVHKARPRLGCMSWVSSWTPGSIEVGRGHPCPPLHPAYPSPRLPPLPHPAHPILWPTLAPSSSAPPCPPPPLPHPAWPTLPTPLLCSTLPPPPCGPPSPLLLHHPTLPTSSCGLFWKR